MGIGGLRMQDRFRYRVWDKKNKEMTYNAEIAYDGMNYNTSWQIGKNTNDGWVDCFGYYLDYPEDYEVMQCTGLYDCNNELIFEKDILKPADEKYEGIFIVQRKKNKGYLSICFFDFRECARCFWFINQSELQ